MRPDLEVADIFRRHGPAYRLAHEGHFGRIERRVMSAIELCRTAALGGHVEACEDCAHAWLAYNSCRNRHCPKCQSAARDQWLAARQADLLPLPYFHVVFTVPAEIAAIAYQNKALVYGILFDAVAATLKTISADPRHLGGELGFIAILHTWGQTLTHHPPFIAWFPAVSWLPTGRAGYHAGLVSSCRSMSSPGCFAACSSNGCRWPMQPGTSSSSAISHHSTAPSSSPRLSGRCARSAGSSTPRLS